MGLFETRYFTTFTGSVYNFIMYLIVYTLLFLLVSLFLFFNYKQKTIQKSVGAISLILLSGFPPSPLFFVKIYALYFIYLKFGVIVAFAFLTLVLLFWYATFTSLLSLLENFESIQYLLSLFVRRFRVVYVMHYICIVCFLIGLGLWLNLVM